MFTMHTYLKKNPNTSDLNVLTHTEHSVLNTACLDFSGFSLKDLKLSKKFYQSENKGVFWSMVTCRQINTCVLALFYWISLMDFLHLLDKSQILINDGPFVFAYAIYGLMSPLSLQHHQSCCDLK